MTQMTADLYKAILAMDSYNRGYGAAIKFGTGPNNLSDDTIGLQIGNASILATRGQVDAQSIGFYGIAYTLGAEKIIAYRGTDYLLGDSDQNIGSDLAYGYSIGGGDPISSQGDMAISFYKAVAGSEDLRTANISFTGHSLGGGLAGFVAAISEQPSAVQALIFDVMAFENAANDNCGWVKSQVA
jgi:hypothetical protein